MAFSNTRHVEYGLYCEQWELNKDAASDQVKQKKTKYLPMGGLPKEALNSQENKQLQQYIEHKYNTQVWLMSVFMNFTRPTLSAWIGMIMSKKPTIEFSDDPSNETSLDYLLRNADGAGNGLETVSRLALEASMLTSGGCFYVAAPEGQMTMLSVRDGSVAPRIKMYDRQNILNWESSFINGVKQLTYIKLREWEYYSDEQTSETIEKHIELFLKDGRVTYEITRNNPHGDEYPAQESGDLIENGSVATSIPVYFFGAQDNDECVDVAPISPIAAMNILHYQIYAKHIEQCWSAGCISMHIDHGTQNSPSVVDNNGKTVSIVEFLNPGGIKYGVSTVTHTINGGVVNLLQPGTDNLLAAEPENIEEKVRKLGAQLLIESSVSTATEANLSYGASTSNLVTMADNISKAMKSAIMHIAELVTYDKSDQIKFELNKRLITQNMDANEISAMWNGVMQGLYPLKAAFLQLQRSGKVSDEWTYEDFKREIEEDAGFLSLAGVGTSQQM